ncbi:MAG: 50S ribosomal protein L6 [Clostridiales bacterium]|nr:50S ribosomal protein L6 [Clostridiales bacterium]
MSRIGKMKIAVPAGVTVEEKDRVVYVKGPKGQLSTAIKSDKITIKMENNEITVLRADDNKESRSLHGLYRMLIANMVTGVVTPFTKTLVIAGVGYKAAVSGKKLTLNLGLSHPVEIEIPEGITITCPDLLTVVVSGVSKEQVGQVAAQIKAKRPVEPYHGYGIHYSDEVVVRKEGKTAGK